VLTAVSVYALQFSDWIHIYGKLVLGVAIWLFIILMFVREFRKARGAVVSDISGPYDETIRIISDLPRPRPVRMSSKGKQMGLVVLSVPLVVFALAAYEQRHHPTPGTTMEGLLKFFGEGVGVMAGLFWLPPYVKHKPLITEGELAIGRITKFDKGRIIYVFYEFETPSGERVFKMSTTFRTDLAAGMKLPVFYNRENPKKAVALCASLYDVALPH